MIRLSIRYLTSIISTSFASALEEFDQMLTSVFESFEYAGIFRGKTVSAGTDWNEDKHFRASLDRSEAAICNTLPLL